MDWLIPLLVFVAVTTVTPGPNNVLLASSGIRYGVRRTLPHLLGIHIGVYTLVVLCGLGLGQALMAIPAMSVGLKVFATGYLIYLAWQILGLNPAADTDSTRPMKIWEAGLFQITNPKAWMMAIAGLNIALSINHDMLSAVLALCAGFATLGTLCNLIWLFSGASLHAAYQQPKHRRLINSALATITVLTVVLFWLA